MRTNHLKLEAVKDFPVKLAYAFASSVFVLILLALLLVVGFANSSFAQDAQPKTFASPGEASDSLFQATQKEDEPALEAILGAGKEVTSSSDEKLARAKALGADQTINYRSVPEWGKAAADWTGDGVDHVVEVGGKDTFNQSLEAARVGGEARAAARFLRYRAASDDIELK